MFDYNVEEQVNDFVAAAIAQVILQFLVGWSDLKLCFQLKTETYS